MPRTTALFAIAAFSVCAIPPFSGFASKWAIYQSLFQFATSTSLPLVRAVALIAIALLSAVGALSVGAFAKALGLASWAVHGRKLQLTPLTQAESVLIGQSILALSCIALGALPILIMPLLVP